MASNSKKTKKQLLVSREEYETLQSEFLACQRKLQSKDEAVKILRRELELTQEEKEELTKQMNQIKNFLIDEDKSSPLSLDEEEETQEEGKEIDYSKRISQLEAHTVQLKQRHREEIQSLKEKLSHARNALSSSVTISSSELAEERSRLIAQLETAQGKIVELQRETQSLEDEKEDLISERDFFSGKCTSLTKCLEEREKSKPPSLNTLEHLLDENRKLKIDLVECEAEKESALNKIERYKRAVERRKIKESQSEALESLTSDKLSELRKSVRRVQELESLANGLSEEIKEKSLALTHQRKTNKLLGTRIAELEHRLKVLEISGLWSTNTSLDECSPLPQHEASITFDEENEGQVSEDTKKKASSDVNGSETTSGVLRPSPLQESSEYSSQSSNVSSTANPIVANV